MKFKEMKAKLKVLCTKWYVTLKAFIKHPIQYTKAYFKNFKGLSQKEKIKKILLAAAFIAASIYAFRLVLAVFIAVFLSAILIGSSGVEIAKIERAQWMVREYGGKESDYL